MLYAAKGLLTPTGVKLNTQRRIISAFDEHFIKSGEYQLETPFSHIISQMKTNPPTADFAHAYAEDAKLVVGHLNVIRKNQLVDVTTICSWSGSTSY